MGSRMTSRAMVKNDLLSAEGSSLYPSFLIFNETSFWESPLVVSRSNSSAKKHYLLPGEKLFIITFIYILKGENISFSH